MSSITVQCQSDFDILQVNRTDLIKWLKEIPKGVVFDVHLSAYWVEEREILSTVKPVQQPTEEPAPEKKNGDHYHKHDNGNSRSMNNRWEIALLVGCPNCGATKGNKCYNLLYLKQNSDKAVATLKYPHNKRFQEGLRVYNEESVRLNKEAELPIEN